MDHLPLVTNAAQLPPPGLELFDTHAIESLRRSLRVDPHLLRKFNTSFFKKFKGSQASLQLLPAEVREDFSKAVRFHALEVTSCHDSKLDGASKLLFRTATGYVIESVILRIATGRTTLCLSSQVGCAAACSFCATGRMGVAQNLTPAEILDQVVQAGEIVVQENRTIRNLVFMGMGEPLHNEENLYTVLETLLNPKHFHWPANRILVSTVGIPNAMLRLARRFPQVNIALSLHSANQDTRASIIPLARLYPLSQIRSTLQQLNVIQKSDVMLEYLMLAGLNDTEEAANELIEFVTGLNVHINLIPYNEVAEAPHLTGSSRQVRDRFAKQLKNVGIKTTIRYSLGSDIEAACGQLVRKENRLHAIELKQTLPPPI